MRKREQVSLTLDKELIKKIENVCHPDVPLSRCMERILREGLEASKKK